MGSRLLSRTTRAIVGPALAATTGLALGVLSPSTPAASAGGASGTVVVVAAENEYSNVASQIGGMDVKASAIMSNPNTDPHTFESSPKVAQVVGSAEIVIQNGLGYDTFMTKIESASANKSRKVISVQKLLGLPAATKNPHLWYDPTTMPAVAKQIASDLTDFQPDHAAYFQENLAVFLASMTPYDQEIAKIKAAFPGAPVATTEPVADYMLTAAGIENLTPWTLQADIMDTTDPSPEDVSIQDSLFTAKKVKVLVYNRQVTSSVTEGFLKLAEQEGIPVVGVYETMPNPGYEYQSWMLAEADALYTALSKGTSSPALR